MQRGEDNPSDRKRRRSHSKPTSKTTSPLLRGSHDIKIAVSPLQTSTLAITPPLTAVSLPSPSLLPDASEPLPSSSGRKREKKKKLDKKGSTVVTTTTTTSLPVHSSKETVSEIDHFFSRVELFFQLEMDAQRRSSLFPRDLGNLLLWSLPSLVPVVESPVVFLIKNKSRLREVVMVYVNGWSYDMMMCTGVGLKRTEGADSNRPSPVWSSKVCAALLQPVRCNQCWARPEAAVQYGSLSIPNSTNTLESEIFWRNDYPRLPRSARRIESTAPPPSQRGVVEKEEEEVSSPTSTARGASSAFLIAKEMHQKGVYSPTVRSPTDTADPSGPTTAGKEGEEEEEEKKKAVERRKAVWHQAETLQQYSLQLPEDTKVLTELGFITTVPKAPPPAEEGEEALLLCDQEVWTEFCPVKKHYQKYRQREHKEDAPPLNPYTSYQKEIPTVFALDCEMVQVGKRVSVLARATLVDVVTEEVVVDLLVKPRDPVTDYLTRYSGIQEEQLASCDTTLEMCQQELKRHIHTETYIVGHSLENDFKALKIIPNCRILDSAWLFPHPSGLPYKNSLRYLAQRFLKKKIQQGSHDSSVDALTSAQLVFLKLLHGPNFGVRQKVSVLELLAWGGVPPHVKEEEPSVVVGEAEKTASVVDATPVEPPKEADGTRTDTEEVNAAGHKVPRTHIQLFDDAAAIHHILPPHPLGRSCRLDAVTCRHDEDVTRKVVKALQQRHEVIRAEGEERPFHFLWAQLATGTAVDVVLPQEGEATAYEAEQLAKVEETNRRVMRMIEAAADGTMVVVVCGDCRGREGGNYLSRAQGACFGFVKDSVKGKGVPENYFKDSEVHSPLDTKEATTTTTTTTAEVKTVPVVVAERPEECRSQ